MVCIVFVGVFFHLAEVAFHVVAAVFRPSYDQVVIVIWWIGKNILFYSVISINGFDVVGKFKIVKNPVVVTIFFEDWDIFVNIEGIGVADAEFVGADTVALIVEH